MPAPGDQHMNGAIQNPFDEPVPRISEFTAVEIATLQSRLDKQLGPEYISTRAGPGGGRVHYLAAEKVINLANEVFGFNGWSSSIQRFDIDFVDVTDNSNKVSLGMSVVVRVTLRDGTFHEDVGYGHIENCRGKAAAFEKARKEAVTDALKRALRSFGKVLGNCLYDKDYLQKVTKIKIAPSKWDESNLHRHPDYAPIKREAIADEKQPVTPARIPSGRSDTQYSEVEDDFGAGGLFDGVELSAENAAAEQEDVPRARPAVAPQPQARPQAPQRHASMLGPAQTTPQAGADRPMRPPVAPTSNSRPQPPLAPPPIAQQRAQPPLNSNERTPVQARHPQQPQSGDSNQVTTPGFVSSRAVARTKDEVLTDKAIATLPQFNPTAESPSIKRTPGVDHTKSAGVSRATVGQAPKPEVQKDQEPPYQQLNAAPVPRPPQPQPQPNGQAAALQAPQRVPTPVNYVTPGADPARRVGMPPGANRTPYKPHSGVKRPHPGDARQPLADVSNATAGQPTPAPTNKDAKAEGVGEANMKRTRVS